MKHLLFFLSFLCLSATQDSGTRAAKPREVPHVSGLQALYALPLGSHIQHCDLSRQGLTKMPLLSMFRIDTLDLSYNHIDTLDNVLCLPQDVVSLNLSHNNMFFANTSTHLRYADRTKRCRLPYELFINFYPELFPKLKALDISYNKFSSIVIPLSIQHLNAEHCELHFLRVYQEEKEGDPPFQEDWSHIKEPKFTYLNVRFNPELSTSMDFHPERIDTLLTEGSAKGEPLKFAPWMYSTM